MLPMLNIVAIKFLCLSMFQIEWVQQQHEKVRKKRDFTGPDFTSVFGGPGDFSSLFDAPNPAPRSPLIRESGYFPSSNVFPDPLFREQWYLVSPKPKFSPFTIDRPTSPLLENERNEALFYYEGGKIYLGWKRKASNSEQHTIFQIATHPDTNHT